MVIVLRVLLFNVYSESSASLIVITYIFSFLELLGYEINSGPLSESDTSSLSYSSTLIASSIVIGIFKSCKACFVMIF